MDDDVSIAIGPLAIWIVGRQFPNLHDYWDGNWLSASPRESSHLRALRRTGSA
jgi:hypothetical protein